MEDIAPTERDEPANRATPLGYCECRCGQRTKLAPRNRRDRGWIKGQPMRWVRGHGTRKSVRYVETPSGYETPCWLWQLQKNSDGYGRVRVGKKQVMAHCVYFEERYGPIPQGTELDHLCRVRACVNPDHLEPVSHAENCRRGRRTKLTAEAAADIRASDQPQRVLARKYGITQGHVSRIKSGHSWSPGQ
jgi:hypothetical protein